MPYPRSFKLLTSPAWLNQWVTWMLLLTALVSADPSSAHRAASTEVTSAVGIDYTQYESETPEQCLTYPSVFSCEIEWMTGGAAVADVDGDGYQDLYVTRLHAPDILYRNHGGEHFEDITSAAGLGEFDLQSNGAAFGDVDNDGDPDLYVTVVGLADDPVNHRFYLFINDGQGRFHEEAVARGADVASGEPRAGFSISFGDYDRDGWLDLHTNEWSSQPGAPGALPHARLLRNRGAEAPGHFEDVTVQAGVQVDRRERCLAPGGVCTAKTFASAFSDLDGDGWPDLAIAADFGRSLLFWNAGDGSFIEGAAAAGVGTDENGMGSTLGDFDRDGDLDWFVTSIFDPLDTCADRLCNWGATGNRLYRNEGGREFSDATDAAGVRDGGWGWGTVFFDYDNDGDLDLAMTNGVDFPGTELDTFFRDDPMRLWQNGRRGRMREVAARRGLVDRGSGKGLLYFDFDRDGDQDLFVVNNAGPGRLFRNDAGNRRRWLRVVARTGEGSRYALGARVEVTARRGGPTQIREIGAGGYFLGQSERVAHFGLGRSWRSKRHARRHRGDVWRVRVVWPNETISDFHDVPGNTTLELFQPPGG